MTKISAFFFLLFISCASQVAVALPQDVAASIGKWLHSSHESLSSLVLPDFDILRNKTTTYTEEMLNDAATQYASIQHKIKEFKETMNRIVTSAEGMGTILQNVDLEEFQNRFEVQLSSTWEGLKQEFSEPLPEDQTERYQHQVIMVSQALDMIEDALVEVCGFWKIPEADVRIKFGNIKPHLNHGLLVIANITNNHPYLLETLLISAVLLIIIPEDFILGPILRLFGFGPLGPVKGTLAASSQRLFFGAAVAESSWFAMLQRLGMKIVV